jgi:hypothetical protein
MCRISTPRIKFNLVTGQVQNVRASNRARASTSEVDKVDLLRVRNIGGAQRPDGWAAPPSKKCITWPEGLHAEKIGHKNT